MAPVSILAEKMTKGTYRILPIVQDDVDEATRNPTCVMRSPIIRMVN